jgi:thiol-disulfide isomerase/thioredoxin
MLRRAPTTYVNPSQMTGGQTIASSVKNIVQRIGWRNILIIGFVLFVFGSITIYYLYQFYTTYMKNKNAAYVPNREFMKNGSAGSGKEAELMLFYVDWCPHCKTAKPEWENLKNDYEGKTINGYKVLFTEVNCTNESPDIEKMISQYKIEGYPTIKLLKDGQVIEFDAKPTQKTLDQFLHTVL